MTKVFKRLETKLIHAGEQEPRIEGAVSMPILQSVNYEYTGETDYHSLKYIRLSNTPNHVALHQKLAASENAEDALVTASGWESRPGSSLFVFCLWADILWHHQPEGEPILRQETFI